MYSQKSYMFCFYGANVIEFIGFMKISNNIKNSIFQEYNGRYSKKTFIYIYMENLQKYFDENNKLYYKLSDLMIYNKKFFKGMNWEKIKKE